MSDHYIKDDKGDYVRGENGGRLYWSDKDGDSDPKHNQTVYEEYTGMAGILPGGQKTDDKYDPSTGRFK
jgi:hypothetical protein